VANPDSAETTEGAKPTLNAVLMLDLSLSMGPAGGDPDGPGGFSTRLALMQKAVENFLNNQDVTFNQITIYSFGVGAELVGQFTIGENNYIQNAIDTVNGFDSGDLSAGTQYDSAANLVDGRAGSADRYANLSHPAADETNIYFLSDGDPQSGDDLNSSERGDWSDFLSDSNINQVCRRLLLRSSRQIAAIEAVHSVDRVLNIIVLADRKLADQLGTDPERVNRDLIEGHVRIVEKVFDSCLHQGKARRESARAIGITASRSHAE
jgi:hypothetical protein